jgi:hypothetical protein
MPLAPARNASTTIVGLLESSIMMTLGLEWAARISLVTAKPARASSLRKPTGSSRKNVRDGEERAGAKREEKVGLLRSE